MGETLLALLAAHLVADFPLQPEQLLLRKKNPFVLGLHSTIVAVTAMLALGAWPVALILALLVAHAGMDALKVYVLRDGLGSFVADQLVHFVVIAGLALLFPQTFAHGWWCQLQGEWRSAYLVGLCLLSGAIASLFAGSVLIRKATAVFAEELEGEIRGLQNGGAYIGCLERALVLLLILAGQPAGVGFLITAKSILRFGDIREPRQRKLTEYIIIGTFMSFGWGMLVALLTQLGVQHWLPAAVAAR